MSTKNRITIKKKLSIILHACLFLGLVGCMTGSKTENSIDYSAKPAATTPKGDYDFSEGKIYVIPFSNQR